MINLPVRKSYTVNERANPFDELDDEEFRKRFRLTKATVYSTCTSTILENYSIEFTIDKILIHYKSEIPATRAYGCSCWTSPLYFRGVIRRSAETSQIM